MHNYKSKFHDLKNVIEEYIIREPLLVFIVVCSSRIIECVEQEQLIFQTNELINHIPFERDSEAENLQFDQNSIPLPIQQENIQSSEKQFKYKVQTEDKYIQNFQIRRISLMPIQTNIQSQSQFTIMIHMSLWIAKKKESTQSV
ncbi:hypothetical protein pb186bvf_019071 [Paramecium bursaria]